MLEIFDILTTLFNHDVITVTSSLFTLVTGSNILPLGLGLYEVLIRVEVDHYHQRGILKFFFHIMSRF